MSVANQKEEPVCALIRQGLSQKEIRARGFAYRTVAKYFDLLGISRQRRNRITPEGIEFVKQQLQTDATQHSMAVALGVTDAAISLLVTKIHKGEA